MPLADSVWAGLGWAAGALPASWVAPGPRMQTAADVLIHGASAGEVKAARAVREVLLAHAPGRRVVITTGTAAGLLAGADARLPRDVPRHLEAALDAVRPQALVLIEGEIWPNLLQVAARRRLPVGVLGARLSERSSRAHRIVSHSARGWFGAPAAWAAATQDDATRLGQAGVPVDRIAVTGWLKWPAEEPIPEDPVRRALLASHGAAGPLFVLGSVHPGEVAVARRHLTGTRLDPARSRWLVVPRHPGAAARIRRELPVSAVIDPRFGVLRAWFGVADAALVGGGLAGRGTHDLLEPLQAGLRPLCFAGKPDGVSRLLLAQGLAVALGSDPGRALERAPGAWEGLRAAHDGRLTGLQFLALRGLKALS